MVYLDNSATSFPKPKQVYYAYKNALRSFYSNPGRGGYENALKTAEKIYEIRERAAAFFGTDKSENVIFTGNCTQAINMVLKGFLQPGDHVLIPRAAIGNKALTEEIAKAENVSIDDIATYDTVYCAPAWFDAAEELSDHDTFALFTSASGVRGFVSAYPEMDHSLVKAVCIGEMTAAEAAKHGMRIWVSEEATLASLADCLERARDEVRK